MKQDVLIKDKGSINDKGKKCKQWSGCLWGELLGRIKIDKTSERISTERLNITHLWSHIKAHYAVVFQCQISRNFVQVLFSVNHVMNF